MENIGQTISEKGAELLKNLISMQARLLPDLMKDIESVNNNCPTFAFSEILSKNIFNYSENKLDTEFEHKKDIIKVINLN